MAEGVRRSQRDYSLTFKLAVVDQVKKASLATKKPRNAGSLWNPRAINRTGLVA